MSIFETNLALRKTIEDYCEVRDRTIRDYTLVLGELGRIASDLSTIDKYLYPSDATPRMSIAGFTQELDRRMWRVAFDATEIPKYMDAKARSEFENSIKHNPPEFTLENIQCSLLTAASQADEYFARGIYELFRTRPDDYQTNRRHAFKLPEKVIWDYMTEEWAVNGRKPVRIGYGWASDRIDDLDRVFCTLAGLPFVPRALVSAVNDAWAKGNVYDGPLFKIKGFKNGNVHITFKRQDLVDKANKIIADYAGAVIPHQNV